MSTRNLRRSNDVTSGMHGVQELLSTKSGCLDVRKEDKKRAEKGSGGVSVVELL